MGWEAGRLSEVTILFADLRNYTTLTTTLGAERVAALMDKYFRAAYAAIVNRDGIVDKFMGDGLLAWFNCPIRHEDHVQRALAAASELQIIARELGTELSKDTPLELGIAVSTGFAVTGRIGSNHPSDYTAVENIVNLAARLQGEAASGQTILTGEVHKQVGHLLPQAQQVVCSLKGYDKPVTAYTLEEIPKGLVSG